MHPTLHGLGAKKRPRSGRRERCRELSSASTSLAGVLYVALIIQILLFFAALWGLRGTNTHARLSRQRLVDDEDPSVAAIGRQWSPRWARRPSQRQSLDSIEAELRRDRTRWARYQPLRQELAAWNTLRTSVALALVATVLPAL